MTIAAQFASHGWCQGMWRDSDGRICVGMAALLAARDRLDASTVDKSLLVHELEFQALMAVTDGDVDGWNDDPDRTFVEVMDIAERADALLRTDPWFQSRISS